VGVTRGETDLEVGPPREDYPDRADVSVRPESTDGNRVVLSIDAMAGDHGTDADVELTPTEARTLRDRLDEIVRWIAEDGTSSDTDLETTDETVTGER